MERDTKVPAPTSKMLDNAITSAENGNAMGTAASAAVSPSMLTNSVSVNEYTAEAVIPSIMGAAIWKMALGQLKTVARREPTRTSAANR